MLEEKEEPRKKLDWTPIAIAQLATNAKLLKNSAIVNWNVGGPKAHLLEIKILVRKHGDNKRDNLVINKSGIFIYFFLGQHWMKTFTCRGMFLLLCNMQHIPSVVVIVVLNVSLYDIQRNVAYTLFCFVLFLQNQFLAKMWNWNVVQVFVCLFPKIRWWMATLVRPAEKGALDSVTSLAHSPIPQPQPTWDPQCRITAVCKNSLFLGVGCVKCLVFDALLWCLILCLLINKNETSDFTRCYCTCLKLPVDLNAFS